MDHSQTFAISAAGMTLERARAEIAALNLANAHTTAAVGQPAYQPLHVIAQPGGLDPFATLMEEAAAPAPEYRIEPANTAPRMAYEPGHPLADTRGFVAYPGVDPATEMVTMMSATRAYEANVAAMNTARSMALKALEIGGNS